MACFSTAAISYLIEKIRIDLNVAFRDQLLVCDTVTNSAMDQGDYWTQGLQVAVESWAQVKPEAVSRVHYKVWNNAY